MGRKSKLDDRRSEMLLHYYEVLKTEGVEGASLAKVAERMKCYPSILIHYFKNKDTMTLELVDYLTRKYEDAFVLRGETIHDPGKRVRFLIDAMFSPGWTEVIDADVFYALLYLAMRNNRIRVRVQGMYKRLNEYLLQQIASYQASGARLVHTASHIADMTIMLVEGYDLYQLIRNDKKAIRKMAKTSKGIILSMLGLQG